MGERQSLIRLRSPDGQALSILSAAIVVLSMYGVLLPHRLTGLVRNSMSGGLGCWMAAAVRPLLAALLWFTAPVSHTLTQFKALAPW